MSGALITRWRPLVAVLTITGVLVATAGCGKAKYSYDRNLPGLLHGKIKRSPHAHARIKSIDPDAALALPGDKAVHLIKGPASELHYAGDEILALAAETEEQARDAVREMRAKSVKYQVLPHIAS